MNSFRGGMQVHSVPEAERAFDSTGRRLPWAYEYADSDRADRRAEEKGPFGKSTRRRGLSRSRTTTPGRTQADKDDIENLKAMDAAMNNLKERSVKQASVRGAPTAVPGTVPQAPPTEMATAAPEPLPPSQGVPAGAPTEVVVYGIPSSLQYAALSFFERASGGCFYEDYPRDPPTQKFNSLSQASRSAAQRSLSEEALRKKNRFAGGDNWIKVTFDSQESADRACHAGPHVIKGFLVHAELYRGIYSRDDAPIPATKEAVQSATASPSQDSSRTIALQPNDSPTPSGTASSATATVHTTVPPPLASPSKALQPHTSGQSTALAAKPPGERTLRIRGAKLAPIRPVEQALAPASSVWQRTLAKIPIVGWILSGGGELIGGVIPRKEDNTFDSEKASVWWRFWYQVDMLLGSDTCGLKGGLED